jgi:molybdenum cofactor cytidylyltransferase
MTVGAIVLAAGRSSRMGANKLAADLDGKPVVAHVADALAEAGLPVLVVTGSDPAAIHQALAGRPVAFAHAPDFAEGMSRSLAAGLAAAPADWDAALVCLGDMPRIRAATFAAIAAAPPVAPLFQGRRGHPVRWARQQFAALAAISGDQGGKPLLAALGDAVFELPVDDPGVLLDADTPEALAALRRQR